MFTPIRFHLVIVRRWRTRLLAPTSASPPWSPDAALAMMDRHGVAAAITSLSVPGTHFGDDDRARDLARRCNDEARATMDDFPRLGAFATLPLPNVDDACAEAVRALDELQLDGIGLLTAYKGVYLGHPNYDPLLAVLNERAAVVALHPSVHPSTALVSLGVPNFMLEYPFDTTRAAVNLVFADVLDRFPNIRFVLSHGGGTLPFLAWRVSAIATWQMSQPPETERFLKNNFRTRLTDRHDVVTPELIKSLLRRFWYDTALVPDEADIAALRGSARMNQLLFGSDWPYAYETFVASETGHLDENTGLSDQERNGIMRQNALTLFPRFGAIG